MCAAGATSAWKGVWVSLLSTTFRRTVSLTFGDGGEALTKCAVSPAEQVALGPQASACQAIQGHTAGRSPHTAPCKLGNTRQRICNSL